MQLYLTTSTEMSARGLNVKLNSLISSFCWSVQPNDTKDMKKDK